MKILGSLLSLILITSYTVLPFPRTQASAVVELYGTFHAMGISVSIADTDDPDQNALATVEYRKAHERYRTGFPLSRINNTRFVGSLFWLTPGTVYDVRITFSDPNGDHLHGVILQATASTQAEITIPAANNTWIVSPTGNGATCSLAAPCSLVDGINRAQPGDEVRLRGGVYYQGEIALPRSGAPDAPIVIRSYDNEEAVLDGADPTPLIWTAMGDGVYATTTNVPEIGLVTANGARLYPYRDLPSLQNLSWNLPGFYANGNHLYVHLTGNADPTHTALVVSRYNRGFTVEKDYIYFVKLTFRYYGQGAEARAIYFKNASNNLVQDAIFAINNGGITIKEAAQRNVIQDNEFYDTLFTWSWDAVKATGYLERGGVYFGAPTGARGNVIRRNIFHDYFDGFDICASEPMPGEAQRQTNETDVYDNLIYNVGDDGIQVDGWCSNIRLWHNTFHDVLSGISFAPLIGGPVYAIRNLIYHFGVGNNMHDGRSFKFNSNRTDKSGPIYLLHNTADAITATPAGLQISSGLSNGWALIYARNNVWSSTSHALNNHDIGYPVDLDYNNLWNGNQDVLVRWDTAQYATVTAFSAATGQERHGINLNPSFINPTKGNYTLKATSPLIDAGVIIPGINDDYKGLAPDMGAFESTFVGKSRVYLPTIITPQSRP
jgi:hypothetical protein